MKTLTPRQKQKPAAESGQAGSTKSTLDRLAEKSVELVPAISWMQSNGCDPNAAIKAAMAKLIERGNHLPLEQRLLYAKKVVLSEFFFRWASKHRGTTVQKLQENEKTNESEIHPVQFALMETHHRTLMEKLHVDSFAELTKYATQATKVVFRAPIHKVNEKRSV